MHHRLILCLQFQRFLRLFLNPRRHHLRRQRRQHLEFLSHLRHHLRE
jgi:hypothetical protein